MENFFLHLYSESFNIDLQKPLYNTLTAFNRAATARPIVTDTNVIITDKAFICKHQIFEYFDPISFNTHINFTQLICINKFSGLDTISRLMFRQVHQNHLIVIFFLTVSFCYFHHQNMKQSSNLKNLFLGLTFNTGLVWIYMNVNCSCWIKPITGRKASLSCACCVYVSLITDLN